MNWHEQAERALQRAVDLDLGRKTGSLDADLVIIAVGVMKLHRAYYDSGLAQHPEMLEVLRLNGITRRLIEALRDARLADYPAATLNKMYGLTEKPPTN